MGMILIVVGAINWGLVGLGNFFGGDWNLVNLILGGISWLENTVYVLVGLAGILTVVGCKCKECGDACCGTAVKQEEKKTE